ncbi:MAG: sulfatase-like hydrolase/transferase [Tannerella sp.]|jgi:arylsulfatase A-like enzyme|nr:sulfatase-like hydrolase/transferase [Tannerella sp.]
MKYRNTSLFLLSASALVTQAQQPNIVIFLVDDMGLMDTQVPFMVDTNGKPVRYPLNEWYHTPNMERLANRSVRFSTFYAQSVSSPTRASLMTGQNAARHHTTNWINSETNNKTPYGPAGWNWDGIKKQDITLPKLLQQAGYRTIHVGKAHFGCIGSEGENPQNIGFDINIAGSSIGQPGSYYGEYGYGHIKGNKKRAVPGLEKYHGSTTFLSDALTSEAIARITQAVDEKKPFFLYLAHYAVHAPFEADKRFLAHYTSADKTNNAKAFATLIEGMDKSLGDIMDKLKDLGIAENTLIIFLGDNGSDAPLGDEKGHFSSAPLRGKKGTEYEGGTRAPLIIGWAEPDSKNPLQETLPVKQGYIQQQLATVMDIFPTVLSLTGVENPANHPIDGFDLKTQLYGKINKKRTETFLMHFPHAHRGNYFTSYRNAGWKLIYWYHPEDPAHPTYELYHITADPFETNDLSGSNKQKLTSMIKQMADQLTKEGALYPEDANGNGIKPVIP